MRTMVMTGRYSPVGYTAEMRVTLPLETIARILRGDSELYYRTFPERSGGSSFCVESVYEMVGDKKVICYTESYRYGEAGHYYSTELKNAVEDAKITEITYAT